jgi:hypothetical protein
MIIGTGCLRLAPAGRKSVKQIRTGSVDPGSGTLVRQSSVTVGPRLAPALDPTAGNGTSASATTAVAAARARISLEDGTSYQRAWRAGVTP